MPVVRSSPPIDSVGAMTYRVVVWGTGNVGRPALRAIAAHRDLELVGVIVSNPEKVGRDAGELAGIEPLGVTRDRRRRGRARGRRRRGRLHRDRGHATGGGVRRPPRMPAARHQRRVDVLLSVAAPARARRPSCSTLVGAACAEGGASVFVSGIDPGWALDILPALLSGVGAGITEIRIAGAVQLRALRPARSRARGHRLRRSDGRAAAHAPRLLAADGVGADAADPRAICSRSRSTRSSRRSSAARSSARSRCRAWARSKRGRRARSGSRCRRSSAAIRCSWSSTSPESTTTARRTGPRRARPAASTASSSPGIPNLVVSVHGTEPGEPGRRRWGQRDRGEPDRQRDPCGLCRPGRGLKPARPPADLWSCAAAPSLDPGSEIDAAPRTRPDRPGRRDRPVAHRAVDGPRRHGDRFARRRDDVAGARGCEHAPGAAATGRSV